MLVIGADQIYIFCLNDDTTSNGIEQDATLSHSRMTILNGGNVGIGATSPNERLDVQGGAIAVYSDADMKILNTRRNNDNWTGIEIAQSYEGSYGASLLFKTHLKNNTKGDQDTPTEKMRITGDGNVGIGTTDPIEKLDVNGNMILTTNGVNIQRQTDANYDSYFSNLEREIIRYGDSQCSLTGANNQSVTHKIILGYNLDDKRQYDTSDAYTPGQNAIKFQLANSTQSNTTPSINTRMIITGNGSVGIGTTNPGTHLHSIMTANGDSIPDTGINESCHTALGVMGSTPYGLAIGTFQSSGNSWIQAKRFTNGDKFKLLLNPDGGNVGIGTTNPGSKLDVNGDTTINGRLDVDAICDNSTASAGVNHVKFKNTEMVDSTYLGLDTAQEGTLAYDANYNTPNEAGSADLNSETYLDTDRVISGYNNTENTGGMMLRDKDGWTMIPSSRTLKYLHTRLCSLGVGVTPPGTEGELLVSGNVGIGVTNPNFKLEVASTDHTILGIRGGSDDTQKNA